MVNRPPCYLPRLGAQILPEGRRPHRRSQQGSGDGGGDPKDLIGKWVKVRGKGIGLVKGLVKPNRVASPHTIDFTASGGIVESLVLIRTKFGSSNGGLKFEIVDGPGPMVFIFPTKLPTARPNGFDLQLKPGQMSCTCRVRFNTRVNFPPGLVEMTMAVLQVIH